MWNYAASGLVFGVLYALIHLLVWKDWPDPMMAVAPIACSTLIGLLIGLASVLRKRRQRRPD